jgi:predicted XRE-type DNA-binding protein
VGERENAMSRKPSAQGTDNVLVDLGFDDADELSAKAALALKLNELIDQRGLSQSDAAAIIGMTQPKVSQIRRYKLQNISLERLMQALVSLDQRIEIVVQPAHRARAPGITVAARAERAIGRLRGSLKHVRVRTDRIMALTRGK